MNKAIYPGTFDPLTYGHLDIIERASKIYDELVVLIMNNPQKKCIFSIEEREEMILKCIKDFPNVKVEVGEGFTSVYAKNKGSKVMIRGIRAVADYEYELALATSNMRMTPEVETVFLISKPEYSFLSSSITKEIAALGGDISPYIPDAILKDVEAKFKK